MSENITLASKEDLVEALRLRTKQPPFPGGQWELSDQNTDLTLELKVDGSTALFNILPKTQVKTRDLPLVDAALSTPTLIVTNKVSPTMAQKYLERNLSALGVSDGHLILRQPGLIIDTHLPKQSITYTSAEKQIAIFSGKSSRIARALLSNPGEKWTITRLAKSTNLSLARTHEVLNTLKEEEWVTGPRGAWETANSDELLNAWVEADKWSKRTTLYEYATLEKSMDNMAQKLMKLSHDNLAFTQWYAASQRYPYMQPPLCSAYRLSPLSEEEQKTCGMHRVPSGGKVRIIVPEDAGVFQFGQNQNGIPLVSDVQIYIDLLQVGMRGPDQAKALRDWKEFRR